MAKAECQYCYWWKGDWRTTKADCSKTGKYMKYNDDCNCDKFAKK